MTDIKKKFEQVKVKKTNFTNLYRDAINYIRTGNNPFYTTSPGTDNSENNKKLMDSVPVRAAEKSIANLMASIFPSGKKWLNFKFGSAVKNPTKAMQSTMEDIENLFFEIIENSNFYTEIGKCFHDYIIGTAVLQVRKGPSSIEPIIFQACSINEIYLDEGENRQIDTVFRHFRIKANNVKNLWPNATISKTLAEHIAKEDMIELVECVYPAKIAKEKMVITKQLNIDGEIEDKITGEDIQLNGFKYEVRFAKSSADNITLGSNTLGSLREELEDLIVSEELEMNPWICFRWLTAPDEIWGRGPVLTALPDIRQVNNLKEMQFKAMEYMLGPVLLTTETDLNPKEMTVEPRKIIYVNDINGTKPLHLDARVDLSNDEIHRLHANINDTLFAEPLGAIDGAVKTATELTLRQQEMLKRMGPAFNALQFELIKPLVNSVLAIIADWNLYDMEDLKVDGKAFKVSFNSPLAISQDRTDIDNLNEFLAILGSGIYPKEEIAKAMPLPVLIKAYSTLLGIDPRILPSDEKMAQYIEQQEAKQDLEMQAAQNAVNSGQA